MLLSDKTLVDWMKELKTRKEKEIVTESNRWFFLRKMNLICMKITSWKLVEEFTQTYLEEISVVVVFFLGWNMNMKWEWDKFIEDGKLRRSKSFIEFYFVKEKCLLKISIERKIFVDRRNSEIKFSWKKNFFGNILQEVFDIVCLSSITSFIRFDNYQIHLK
jgi:hypothetical protein